MSPAASDLDGGREWYEDFFTGPAMDAWDKASAHATPAEADFIARTLRCPPGGRLLDVPCGRGRHAVALAARGYRLTAVDISQENIDRARGCDPAGAVEFARLDMRRLGYSEAFDGAFCWGNSFGYMRHADTIGFLAGLAKALKPDARFILNTFIAAESILPNFQRKKSVQLDDLLFELESTYHAAESRLTTIYSFTRGGKTQRREGRHFIYSAAEIGRLLSEAGLEPESYLGSLEERPFQLGDPALFVVARKRSR